MKPFKVGEIAEVIKGTVYQGDMDSTVYGVCQDSRLAESGFVFFAVKGDAFDGHDFLQTAIEKGCKCVVVENTEKLAHAQLNDIAVLVVRDTVKALQDLAKFYINSLNVKKIAVTGSTGKTTTRDMTYYVCREKFKTQKNKGNFNSTVGVPLTIMDFDEDIEVAVIEMGMDKAGEIDVMSEIVRPDMALITNIGISHLENFGSRKGIFDAKMEVTNYFDENSKLIVTEDDEFLNKKAIEGNFKLIVTGENSQDDFFVTDIKETDDDGVSFKVICKDGEGHFDLPVPGRHNALNATLAIAAGKQLGVSFEDAAAGLAKMELTGKRLNIKNIGGLKIIDDTYNASPASMKAALDILESTKGKRKIAVLGDMFELGADEIHYHEEVGKYAKERADVLLTVGNLAAHMGADEHHKNIEQFIEKRKDFFEEGDVVLVKASRGMAFEKIVDNISENK